MRKTALFWNKQKFLMQQHHVLYRIARYKKTVVDLNFMDALTVLTALMSEKKGKQYVYFRCF